MTDSFTNAKKHSKTDLTNLHVTRVDRDEDLLENIAFLSYLKGSSLQFTHTVPPAINASKHYSNFSDEKNLFPHKTLGRLLGERASSLSSAVPHSIQGKEKVK